MNPWYALKRLFPSRQRSKPVVHFLHIPKTGGTAIKHALQGAVSPKFEIALHDHGFRLADVPIGEFAVFFLREPIDRFVSGFNSRLRQGKPRYSSKWTADEAIAFERFSTPNDLAEALLSGDEATKQAALHAMNSISHVRDKFSHWFGEKLDLADPRILFVGFQDRLDQDFASLARLLALKDIPALPSSDKDAHRNPPEMSRTLSPKAIATIQDWYADDLDLYHSFHRLMGSHRTSGIERRMAK
ncbi:MAG: sulfotransferase family 2 domain-containing protein [Flavobacteriales bacterium]|nr:sulfotransferase family 2 domain-containing protein [Flavobacteriales bacterium]